MQQNRGETSKNLALDIMLRTFMNSTEFQNLRFKNWDSVAKLIPGITAKQVKTITSGRDLFFYRRDGHYLKLCDKLTNYLVSIVLAPVGRIKVVWN